MRSDRQDQLKSEFVILKNEDWLKRLRLAGRCVSSVMSSLELLVKEKTSNSLLELSEFAEQEILKQGCTPTFKNYKGFPSAVCISVNKQLVHGIPTDYKLREGDVVSFDFGATFEGAIADSAITCIFGEPKSKEHVSMIEVCNNALYAGINAVKVENRIGAIGHAIYRFCRDKGFRVIENYGGHGISANTPHDSPFVPNRAEPNRGIRIQPGLTIAIEPMIGPYSSSTKTVVGKDGWTVYTENIFCHTEHSIFVHNDHTEIITWRKDESDRCSNRIYFDKITT